MLKILGQEHAHLEYLYTVKCTHIEIFWSTNCGEKKSPWHQFQKPKDGGARGECKGAENYKMIYRKIRTLQCAYHLLSYELVRTVIKYDSIVKLTATKFKIEKVGELQKLRQV